MLVFTCRGENDAVEVRHLESGKVNEKEAIRRTVPFKEVGPCFDMKLRREKMANFELFKEACKKPKVRNVEKKKANKNTYTTAFGERVVYLDRNRTFCRKGGCGDTFPLLPKANRYINNSMTHIRILELDTMSS